MCTIGWDMHDLYMYESLYVSSLEQDCSISSALALEILQSCAKPSMHDIVTQLYDDLWVGNSAVICCYR